MAATIHSTPAIAPHLLSQDASKVAPTLETSQSTNQIRPGRDVQATFNYFKDEGPQGPAPTYVNKPETYFRPTESQEHVVRDIRGEEDQFSLDKTGFQVFRRASEQKSFADEEEIKKVYYPEIERILKDATGASRVFIFDHTIRSEAAAKAAGNVPVPNPPPSTSDSAAKPTASLRGPVQRVHVDQSYKAGPERVTHHLPSEAPQLLNTRHQIINVWRPISTIHKDPLGVVDARSVPDNDLVPIKLIYPDREGETFSVRPNEAHKWYYLREQTPEEVLLIKCYDSKLDGRARRVPHSAFVNPEWEGEKTRESIEVRALVFHEDDEA